MDDVHTSENGMPRTKATIVGGPGAATPETARAPRRERGPALDQREGPGLGPRLRLFCAASRVCRFRSACEYAAVNEKSGSRRRTKSHLLPRLHARSSRAAPPAIAARPCSSAAHRVLDERLGVGAVALLPRHSAGSSPKITRMPYVLRWPISAKKTRRVLGDRVRRDRNRWDEREAVERRLLLGRPLRVLIEGRSIRKRSAALHR